jgi:hypothetical protein
MLVNIQNAVAAKIDPAGTSLSHATSVLTGEKGDARYASINAPQIMAWVVFNGSGTVSIIAGYNVLSITDLGTGQYRVNFTTPLPDINYSVSGMATRGGGGSAAGILNPNISGQLTTSMEFRVSHDAAAFVNSNFVSIQIIR